MNEIDNKRGFTLIELLVVIAIIGVLASSVLAKLSHTKAVARDSVRISEIKEIEKALALYYANSGSFPIITASIFDQKQENRFTLIPRAFAEPISASDGISTTIEGILYPQYLSALPEAPGNRPYYYESDGSRYCLGVELEVASSPTSNNANCINGGSNIGISPALLNYSSRRFVVGNVTTFLGC